MSREFELSRRKILGAVGGVGIASAGAGMGTSAFFSDTESFEGNSMIAGELDLKVDWQQTYDGPSTSRAPAETYGTKGKPWINAHPDHDGDGIQSLDSDEFDSVDDDGVVTYEDSGANIQEYLTCETLDHNYDFGPNDGKLIELEDVKPGDSGEVTFSFHLCDNPGYVWFTGNGFTEDENGVNEPEGESDAEGSGVELAEEIKVTAWYDLDCDNVYENGDGEDVIVDSPTTLKNFFENRLTAKGRMLNPNVYAGGTDTTVTDGDQECNFLGKIEWGNDGNDLSVETDDSGVDGEVVTSGTDSEWYVVRIEDTVNSVEVYFLFDSFKFKDGEEGNFGEVECFDWEILDGQGDPAGNTYNSDAEGMCRLDIKAGTETTEHSFDLIGAGCSSGEDQVCSPNSKGISYTEFYYCPPGGGSGTGTGLCFPGGQTFCVGFKWELPAEVGNEVQTDKVSFDLGFYTEQCRHNDNPTGPTSS